ncbi:NUDIX hydrolase [Ruegeria sp. HKCCD8929]|uniref:NUDIX hydrolase n=1 Tax=Ruegeria sp. HKCCD8929 TaxID=2683006 RepID=UPI0020C39146|nr:NUDIX hydrolase [Ruegeria sp. HKCCD8929]
MGSKPSAGMHKGIGKAPPLIQYGALCYRIDDRKPQILLVTSRGTGRWVVPKGWPMEQLGGAGTAAREAWEEAGVVGTFQPRCLGQFVYTKMRASKGDVPIMVQVYPVLVRRLAREFPESGQRRRKWFSPNKASMRVDEPELSRILRSFHPRVLH